MKKQRPKTTFVKGEPTSRESRGDASLARAFARGDLETPKTKAARRHALAQQRHRIEALAELRAMDEIRLPVVVEQRGSHFVGLIPSLSLEFRGASIKEAERGVIAAAEEEITLDPVGVLEAVNGRRKLETTAKIKLGTAKA